MHHIRNIRLKKLEKDACIQFSNIASLHLNKMCYCLTASFCVTVNSIHNYTYYVDITYFCRDNLIENQHKNS